MERRRELPLKTPRNLKHLRGVLKLLVLDEPPDMFGPGILFLFRCGIWVGRQQHAGFDVDQLRSDDDELRSNIHIHFLH